jgi:hypothetical protein
MHYASICDFEVNSYLNSLMQLVMEPLLPHAKLGRVHQPIKSQLVGTTWLSILSNL